MIIYYETKFDKTRGFEFKFAIRNGLLTYTNLALVLESGEGTNR